MPRPDRLTQGSRELSLSIYPGPERHSSVHPFPCVTGPLHRTILDTADKKWALPEKHDPGHE